MVVLMPAMWCGSARWDGLDVAHESLVAHGTTVDIETGEGLQLELPVHWTDEWNVGQ